MNMRLVESFKFRGMLCNMYLIKLSINAIHMHKYQHQQKQYILKLMPKLYFLRGSSSKSSNNDSQKNYIFCRTYFELKVVT